ALTAVAPAAALAQNGYSFLDAQSSPVHYGVAPVTPAMTCADVAGLATAETTIVSVRVVPAMDGAPEHCRVTGLIQPEIRFELNLPANWNRRFYMHGNGGFAGESPEFGSRPMIRANALKQGFAVAQTNTGHDATAEPLATFAMSYPKRVDYAFRAVHLTAVEGKRLTAAYYGRAASYAYWDGCSTGGRQGLISAQRFPQDFDGIIAGAPVLNFVDTVMQSLWNGLVLVETPIPVAKMKLVSDAVYARCDAKDGLKDGLIDDPRRCDFDPARDVAQCPADKDGESCLTAAQTAALKKIYAGVQVDGKPAHFGQMVGAETGGLSFTGAGRTGSGWAQWLIPPAGGKANQHAYGESFAKYFLAKPDPNLDAAKVDFARDIAKYDEARALLNATDPDLGPFRARGGKLLMYFGWADTALPPLMGIDYYLKAVAANGPATPEFFRLFMVPGMFHCRGGVGTDRLDAMTAMVNWVENGVAPASITAAQMDQGKLARTRPLCPYPQVARYSGSGSPDDAANFACKPTDQ
ncbi:MAG: tannase/feruloyl esterase family alpha/beta hydrolase, partial [Alphaproteobacteria bacterium]|nr:tannase/feruloyl esterase family alpha/beta hydrolase [Alphaproteobacteria bacterium]